VLPTGRNIHALDPYRMPGLAALDRGKAAADAILRSHREGAGGAWPETVAVNLWGLDSIKTKGESVAIVLRMVGAAPVKEGTGRIVRFELLPLEGEPFGGGGRGELAGGWGVCRRAPAWAGAVPCLAGVPYLSWGGALPRLGGATRRGRGQTGVLCLAACTAAAQPELQLLTSSMLMLLLTHTTHTRLPLPLPPELGRPRIDVLCNMSGIFRDSFQNVVELLDDLFQARRAPTHCCPPARPSLPNPAPPPPLLAACPGPSSPPGHTPRAPCVLVRHDSPPPVRPWLRRPAAR
jgi:hypothetical protein